VKYCNTSSCVCTNNKNDICFMNSVCLSVCHTAVNHDLRQKWLNIFWTLLHHLTCLTWTFQKSIVSTVFSNHTHLGEILTLPSVGDRIQLGYKYHILINVWLYYMTQGTIVLTTLNILLSLHQCFWHQNDHKVLHLDSFHFNSPCISCIVEISLQDE